MRQLKGKYLIAGIITLLIFLLGMLLGLVMEGKRVTYIQTQAREQKLDFISLQLQYQLIEELSQQGNCPAVSATFDDFLLELARTEERLTEYQQDSKLNKKDFDFLKQEYVQAQVNYWLLAKKTKEICNRDVVNILYFYSPSEKCPQCDTQGFVLTYLKDLFKDKVLVFSFDSSFEDEKIIDLLIKTYNVTEYPSVVVEDKLISGFSSRDELLKEICPLYEEKPEECTEI